MSLIEVYIVPAAYKLGIKNPKQIEIIATALRSGSASILLAVPESGVTTMEQVEVLTLAGKQTLVDSYPIVYYVSIAFGGVAVIASCFLTGISEQMGSGVAVRLA